MESVSELLGDISEPRTQRWEVETQCSECAQAKQAKTGNGFYSRVLGGRAPWFNVVACFESYRAQSGQSAEESSVNLEYSFTDNKLDLCVLEFINWSWSVFLSPRAL